MHEAPRPYEYPPSVNNRHNEHGSLHWIKIAGGAVVGLGTVLTVNFLTTGGMPFSDQLREATINGRMSNSQLTPEGLVQQLHMVALFMGAPIGGIVASALSRD